MTLNRGNVHDGYATVRRTPSQSMRNRLSQVSPPLDTLFEFEEKPAAFRRVKMGGNGARDVPWWEIATRRSSISSFHSCGDFQANVVSAFEKSLSNMTQRLQQLTTTAEKKDTELSELRRTIEMLRQQPVVNGNVAANGAASAKNSPQKADTRSPGGARRHTINPVDSSTKNNANNNISRQLSADSVASLVSMSSACSISSSNQHTDTSSLDKNKKKRGWLRSSFSKAFSRSVKKGQNGSASDAEDGCRATQSDLSAPSSPMLNSPHQMNGGGGIVMDSRPPIQPVKNGQFSASYDKNESNGDSVNDLKKQLREKDLILTDIRLEALSSAHQLESLKDTVIKMRNEMLNLKQNNERLQRIISSKSSDPHQSNVPSFESPDRRYSTTDVPIDRTEMAVDIADAAGADSKKVSVSVYLGSHGSYQKYATGTNEISISVIPVSTKCNWKALDYLVTKAFKDYLERVDPGVNLGLSGDSIRTYHVGEISRCRDGTDPELLPCGYFVGTSARSVKISLKGSCNRASLDALAFETLVPKCTLQRYVTLLNERRKVMLCGPKGTGKSYLAVKLGEFLAYRDGKDANAVVTIDVSERGNKEAKTFLSGVLHPGGKHASGDLKRLPAAAVILKNLPSVDVLNEILDGHFEGGKGDAYFPFLVGTLSRATCATPDFQLDHNFRWILCANHMEPVKGFLARFLKRKLVEHECKYGAKSYDLLKIVDWIPKIQQYLNDYLETRATSDAAIGPKLFASCPMEVEGSQVWFTHLWNHTLIPYLSDAVRDGLQLYGERSVWEDPAQFVIKTYPWGHATGAKKGVEALTRLQPEDVGLEVKQQRDPLLNMLMTLQEAANYPNGEMVPSNKLDETI